MSIIKMMETGGSEEGPFPMELVELQQIVIGFFLIWDVLGDDIRRDALEQLALNAFCRRHKMPWQRAVEMLVMTKERFRDQPFAHLVLARDFKNEGWADVLMWNPDGNRDVIDTFTKMLASRPFKE